MRTSLDRPLLVTLFCLCAYGLAMVYSAGQTDVPSFAERAWIRQSGWMVLGVIGGAAAFKVSFRLLEWSAPYLYGLGLLLLLVVLFAGTGAGTAASSNSWLTIAGVRLGQPVELAKIGTVLLLARYLSGLRQPPASLRDLIKPGLIAGVPFILVMGQPDLGSAIVFVGVVFAMLFWAGVRPSLLLLLA